MIKVSEEAVYRNREGLGLNRKELSSELGMSASSVRNIEKGYKNPGYNFLKVLNEKYPDIDILEWFGFKVVS